MQVPELGIEGNRTLRLAPEQFVIGFSRGYAGKSVFIWPRDVGEAWARSQEASGQQQHDHHLQSGAPSSAVKQDSDKHVPRGVMFWNINNDGGPVNGTSTNCSFTKEFNAFLHVRG
jgi:hypothetical protein